MNDQAGRHVVVACDEASIKVLAMLGKSAPYSTSIFGEAGAGGGAEVIDVSGHKPRKIPPPTWRECIKKVWEVDPLQCPRCAGEMKIIGFITEAPVVRKILEHLHLWSTPRKRGPPPRDGPEPQAPAQGSPSPRSQEPESFDDPWPGYEEPFITYD